MSSSIRQVFTHLRPVTGLMRPADFSEAPPLSGLSMTRKEIPARLSHQLNQVPESPWPMIITSVSFIDVLKKPLRPAGHSLPVRRFSRFNSNSLSSAVRREFRCIHALQLAHPAAVITGGSDKNSIFNCIVPFGNAVKKEIGACIFCRLIKAESALPAIAAQYIGGFEACCAGVFKVHVFQVTVGVDQHAYHKFVASLQWLFCEDLP